MKQQIMRQFRDFTLTPCLFLFGALILLSLPTRAEVTSVNASGFALNYEQTVKADRDAIYTALSQIGQWWDPSHSWEGVAENLYLELSPGGCFCETLSNGGLARHLQVLYYAPGKEIRLGGGLGPLQGMGMWGAMVWTITPAEEGNTVKWTYTVTGHGTEESMKGLAPIVNSVQQQAFDRLIRYIKSGSPE
ncbi:MAG: hypothetical protein R3348_03560 [Xanthomonadales bacterium]|nr:hypothetical protein [Xanthomonadales bacterium]